MRLGVSLLQNKSSIINVPDFSIGADKARAVILSCAGLTLSEEERGFFKEFNPLGFILFKRNVDNPAQLKALIADLKETVGRDCPVLIDQEGGRVQRMGAPHWDAIEPPRVFGKAFEDDMQNGGAPVKQRTLALAQMLGDVGLNVNCDPVMDVAFPQTHDVIGDRALSADPDLVALLAEAICILYLRNGIVPIMKHIPGHGRAKADSHLELPVVDASLDELRQVDMHPFSHVARSPDIGKNIWAMSAHILYTALDADLPFTLSAKSIEQIVRREIAFDGFLVSDDLSMKALDAYGDLGERSAACIAAGCDASLYCAGKLDEMQLLAPHTPILSEKALKRLHIGALSA